MGQRHDQVVGSQLASFNYAGPKIPLVEKAVDFANMGIVPAGARRKRDFRLGYLKGHEKIRRP